jgi:hypothetical protein
MFVSARGRFFDDEPSLVVGEALIDLVGGEALIDLVGGEVIEGLVDAAALAGGLLRSS